MPMGLMNHRPSIWCFKYYFFSWFLAEFAAKILSIYLFIFLKNTKIKVKSFECPKSIKSLKKIILGTSDAWSTIHLSNWPSDPAWIYLRLTDFLSTGSNNQFRNQRVQTRHPFERHSFEQHSWDECIFPIRAEYECHLFQKLKTADWATLIFWGEWSQRVTLLLGHITKLWNQVPSLDHLVIQNSGDFLCWKLR